ncbi:energy transducer TonB [Azovibrio restrictus]|uniref:energy transducer TonB n=1 Tax=Azovibrio restrictus TaxID=146938 RepID=UPI0026EEE101|nr:energy transducer TonB [Azovibrio restrictus]
MVHPSLPQAFLISLALHGLLLTLPAGKVSGTPFSERSQRTLKSAPDARTVLMLTWKKQESPSPSPQEIKPAPDRIPPLPPPAHRETPEHQDQAEPEKTVPDNPPAPDGKPTLGSGHYFLREEVERMPRILEDPGAPDGELEQQLQAHTSGGRLVLELWISEHGYVDRIDILESTQKPELEQLLTRGFAQARFFPAQRQSVNVKSRLKIEVVVQPRWQRIELE